MFTAVHNMSQDLELVYFPIEGRAKPIRLIFEIGNVNYKDTRIAGAEYAAMLQEGHFPLETLPVLKLNGKVVSSQSGAIMRYAAALTGMQLQGPTAVVRGEDVAGTLNDIAELWITWFKSSGEDKEKNAVDFVDCGFPYYCKHIESVLASGQHNGPFINETMSWVDIYLYCMVGYVNDVAKTVNKESPAGKFPRISALTKAVSEIPAVVAHK
jgi:glutathione S-transferase